VSPGTYTRAGSLVFISLLLCLPAWSQQSAADKLIAEGHYSRAKTLVQAAVERHGQDIDALVALSTIQWAYGQFDASVATAERAVLAADGSPITHAQLVNTLGAKLASRKVGNFEKLSLARRFRKEVDRTLLLDPNNLYAHEALARFYWYAPAIGGGSKAKARQLVDRLVRLNLVRGYALKAELDATEGDKTKCLTAVQADWKQAVAADPDSYTAHIGLGGCLLRAGGDKLRGAEDEAKKATALDPSRIDSYRLLAAVYVTTGRWDSLDANLRRALAAVPDDLGADFTAAQTILENNVESQLTRAEEYLRNYLKQPAEGLEPTIAMARWELGVVLEKEGRKSDALQEREIAVSMDSSLGGAAR
jgi:tetratricopeptide (TPR) repeat protein